MVVRTESGKILNKQGPLDKQQRREAGTFEDQDQQYFLITQEKKRLQRNLNIVTVYFHIYLAFSSP